MYIKRPERLGQTGVSVLYFLKLSGSYKWTYMYCSKATFWWLYRTEASHKWLGFLFFYLTLDVSLLIFDRIRQQLSLQWRGVHWNINIFYCTFKSGGAFVQVGITSIILKRFLQMWYQNTRKFRFQICYFYGVTLSLFSRLENYCLWCVYIAPFLNLLHYTLWDTRHNSKVYWRLKTTMLNLFFPKQRFLHHFLYKTTHTDVKLLISSFDTNHTVNTLL